jgi:chaperone required for assembly of F1-ATPase
MKRFWKEVAVVREDGGWAIQLDGRPVRTPARAALVVPTEALAEAIAGEWRSVEQEIDPPAMPVTGLRRRSRALRRSRPCLLSKRLAARIGRAAESRLGRAAVLGAAAL